MSVIEFIGPHGKPFSSNIFNHSWEGFLINSLLSISTSSFKFSFLLELVENFSSSLRSWRLIAFNNISHVFWFDAPIVIHLSFVLKAW